MRTMVGFSPFFWSKVVRISSIFCVPVPGSCMSKLPHTVHAFGVSVAYPQ